MFISVYILCIWDIKVLWLVVERVRTILCLLSAHMRRSGLRQYGSLTIDTLGMHNQIAKSYMYFDQ